jgi:hypothetical protein
LNLKTGEKKQNRKRAKNLKPKPQKYTQKQNSNTALKRLLCVGYRKERKEHKKHPKPTAKAKHSKKIRLLITF